MAKKQPQKHLDVAPFVRRKVQNYFDDIIILALKKFFPGEIFDDKQIEYKTTNRVTKCYYKKKLLASMTVRNPYEYDFESPIFNE